jgi:hypothetical protein
MTADGKAPGLIRFPLARTSPPRTPGGFKDLGASPLARALGVDEAGQHGHWCARCGGIWWGMPLEVECPVCGGRGAGGRAL